MIPKRYARVGLREGRPVAEWTDDDPTSPAAAWDPMPADRWQYDADTRTFWVEPSTADTGPAAIRVRTPMSPHVH
jgi:hypothetical protein